MDTPILKIAKKILKEDKNLVIGISTADGLSVNAENIGKMLDFYSMVCYYNIS